MMIYLCMALSFYTLSQYLTLILTLTLTITININVSLTCSICTLT